jgi:5-hydroxyisourate hydrolase-like protein (transthyretin family)
MQKFIIVIIMFPILLFSFDYQSYWQEVAKYDKQQLPKSAFQKVEKIYEQAKKERNSTEFIRATLYKKKYALALYENGEIIAIQFVEQAIKESEKKEDQLLLNSILAQMYYEYYMQYSYKIQKRTATTDKRDNLLTWNRQDFLTKIYQLYQKSLDESTQHISIEQYRNILTEAKNVEGLRQTLYDFLIFRALNYFQNEASYLHETEEKFSFQTKRAFSDVHTFSQLALNNTHRDSLKYQTAVLYQKLLKFYFDHGHDKALDHVNLQRLKFVKNNFHGENVEKLYLHSLNTILERNANSEALIELIRYYHIKSNYVEALKLIKKALFSKNNFVKHTAINIKHRIETQLLNIQTEEVILPHENILTKVTYRNIDKMYVKILKLTKSQKRKLISISYDLQNDYLKNLTAIKTLTYRLPKSNDYKKHSTELSLSNYSVGEYYFLFSSSQEFYKPCFFKKITVSNLALIQQKEDKLLVVNRRTGKPMRGVQVQLYKNQTLQHEKKTNSKGTVHFKELKENFKVQLKYKHDILDLNNRVYYGSHHSKNTDLLIKRVHFFTDRAIYRPGQSIYFKGLVTISSDKKRPKVLEGESIEVIFKDSQGRSIKKTKFTSDEFGSFHGSFTAPKGTLLGQMNLSSNLAGNAYFRVEEYKQPKFEVNIQPSTKTYALNEKVEVQGRISAFSGNAIGNAKVKYRVERRSNFYWENKIIHYPHPYPQETTLTSGTTTSNKKGEFSINFIAKENPSIALKRHPSYSYIVHVDASDTTGETHSTEHTFHIGHINFKINMQLKEEQDIEEENVLLLESNNLDGEFVAIKGSVDIEKVEVDPRLYRKRYWKMGDMKSYTPDEFKNHFPSYRYEKKSLLKKHLIETLYFNTAKEKKLSLEHLSKGKYLLTLRTYDNNGEMLMKQKELLLSNSNQKGLVSPTYLWQQHKKKEYHAGDKAIINIKSSLPNAKVLLSILQNNKLIKEKWINLYSFHQELIKIKSSHRGDLTYFILMVNNNRQFSQHGRILVPWDNKLKIKYQSFRNKLKPNQHEQWHLKISGKNNNKIMAQMVATIYDASLDTLNQHQYNEPYLFPYSPQGHFYWHAKNFTALNGADSWRAKDSTHIRRQFSTIKWLNNYNKRMLYGQSDSYALSAASMSQRPMYESAGDILPTDMNEDIKNDVQKKPNKKREASVHVRKNLQETMLFKPDLRSNAQGDIFINFTTNDALTRWNFMAFVHTKDLKMAVSKKSFTTAKELMVVSNLPRFFRENDHIVLSAKVVNMSNKELNGTCVLKLVDPATEKPIFNKEFKKKISLKKGASTVVEFQFTVPNVDEVSSIKHTIIAQTPTHSDAEQIIRPILSNRVFITESKNMFVHGNEQKNFTLESFKNNSSRTLSSHRLTLEFSSNPAWYAIKSLPYLMEYPHESNEQLFNRYFANALAEKVANHSPKIKEIFEEWKTKSALLSALETNKELKSVLIEETPWVLNAKSETEQQANLGLLFDLIHLAKEKEATYLELIKRQFEHKDGGWAWFESPQSNWYITQYIVEGFGKLKRLGIDKTTTEAMGVATHYMDMQMLKQYKNLLKNVERKATNLKDDHLSSMLIHYLYARSFYTFKMSDEIQQAHDYYLEQSKQYWGDKGLYEQGMIALTLNTTQEKLTALNIVASLKERALQSDELGMYFKYDNGYAWNQLPIETHALLMDVFNTVGNDQESVKLLKTWLLKNKQTNHWKTTKATASAIYALLYDAKWLQNEEQVELYFNTTLPYQEELKKATIQAGTGYIKASFKTFDKSMATVTVNNPNESPAWGALYWQYFEKMDKVKNFKETALKLTKKLFLIEQRPEGKRLSPIVNQILQVGDKVKVRIELTVDRNMEYIMLKDTRASTFEPLNILSKYKYQDGLGYYESTKDNATYFFMDYLPKGKYVFEYPLLVTQKGDFSNGITTIESMYAPEFKSHSEGVRVEVQ